MTDLGRVYTALIKSILSFEIWLEEVWIFLYFPFTYYIRFILLAGM